MTSASILITMGAEEQTKMRPVSDDLISDQGISFAKSFQERVEGATSKEGGNPSSEAAIPLSGANGIALTKRFDEVADIDLLSGVKGKVTPTPHRSAHGELKSVIGAKVIPSQATTVSGKEGATASDSMKQTVELPVQVEDIAKDVSPSFPIPCAKTPSRATNESFAPQLGIAEGDQPLVSRGNGLLGLKEKKTAGTRMEGITEKKTAKTLESELGPKTVLAFATAIVAEAKSTVGTSAESGVAVAGQTTAVLSEKREISKAADVLGKAVSPASKPSTAVSPMAGDALTRKDVAAGTKAPAADTEMTATAENDRAGSLKTGVTPEKASTIALPGGGDSENKPKSVQDPGMTLFHSMGIVSSAVAPTNVPSELNIIKLPVGDAGAHATTLANGLREQDGPGGVAQLIDGTPRMLAATPTSLEVGIQNGTHGWLKVRAEMADGGVNASVSAASSVGQEMLHRELPALTSYLQEEKVGVNAVVVHAPTSSGTDGRGSSGMDGTGGQTQGRNNEGDERQSFRKATSDGLGETTTYPSLHEVNEDGTLSLAAYGRGGSWLSVRA